MLGPCLAPSILVNNLPPSLHPFLQVRILKELRGDFSEVQTGCRVNGARRRR